jgi:2-methylisocitrate lyase-like PEP mutase family enzyme
LDKQKEYARKFLALHHEPTILILPNAWDVASAKVLEIEGFKAIGTTSAGISASLGYPDGQKMSLIENLNVVRRIVDHIDLPISVDIEAGYSNTTMGIVETAQEVIKAGAIGLNLEDGTGDASEPLVAVSCMRDRIAAIREATSMDNLHLFIYARTDSFLIENLSLRDKIMRTIERANAYRKLEQTVFLSPMSAILSKKP